MGRTRRTQEGVGLRFEGFPQNISRFDRVLNDEGCHPKAAKRILERLVERGYDLLTVQSDLNFDWIKKELGLVGVEMTFIEPQENWVSKYDDGSWPREALPERLRV